jgi:hypothetical protein
VGRPNAQHELERLLQDFLSEQDDSACTFELPDRIVEALVELEDMQGDSPDADPPGASVPVSRGPGPSPRRDGTADIQ